VTPSSVAATSEILDAENVMPESSAPLQLTTSLDSGKDDIDKNPLIEGTAHLVLSPGGGERRKYCKTMYKDSTYELARVSWRFIIYKPWPEVPRLY
jgi:hypothetical protein